MLYETMPPLKKITKERYVYDCKYVMYTIKVGKVEYLERKITIPSIVQLEKEELTKIISDVVNEQINAQTHFDNYDLVRLDAVEVESAYDRELEV
jgi:hypothetical protein